MRAPPPYNRTMAFKRRGEPATIDDEREALREQRVALEDLKRQLAERVQAVRERELELHHALAEASSPLPAERRVPAAALPQLSRPTAGRTTRARTRSRPNDASRRSPSASGPPRRRKPASRSGSASSTSSGGRCGSATAPSPIRSRRRPARARRAAASGTAAAAARASRTRPARADRGTAGGAARRREAVPPHPRRARGPERGGRCPRAPRRPEGARARRPRGRRRPVGRPRADRDGGTAAPARAAAAGRADARLLGRVAQAAGRNHTLPARCLRPATL